MASTFVAVLLMWCVCMVSGASLYQQRASRKTRNDIRDTRKVHNLVRRSSDSPSFESEQIGLDFQEHGHPLFITSNLYKELFQDSTSDRSRAFVDVMQTVYEHGTNHWKQLINVIYNDLKQILNVTFDVNRIGNAGSFKELCESIIYLYTVESPLYGDVNWALRNPKSNYSVYGSYALMLNTILLNWPSIQVCRDATYRGVSFDVTNYVVGTIFTWTAFTSSSTDINLACDQFANSALFIFNNDVHTYWSSKQISPYSAFKQEDECLYPAPAIFNVTAIKNSSTTDNLCNRPGLTNIYISLQQGYRKGKSEPDGGNVIEGTAYTVVAAVIVAKYWFFI